MPRFSLHWHRRQLLGPVGICLQWSRTLDLRHIQHLHTIVNWLIKSRLDYRCSRFEAWLMHHWERCLNSVLEFEEAMNWSFSTWVIRVPFCLGILLICCHHWLLQVSFKAEGNLKKKIWDSKRENVENMCIVTIDVHVRMRFICETNFINF